MEKLNNSAHKDTVTDKTVLWWYGKLNCPQKRKLVFQKYKLIIRHGSDLDVCRIRLQQRSGILERQYIHTAKMKANNMPQMSATIQF